MKLTTEQQELLLDLAHSEIACPGDTATVSTMEEEGAVVLSDLKLIDLYGSHAALLTPLGWREAFRLLVAKKA